MQPFEEPPPVAADPASGAEAALLITDVAALVGVSAAQLRSWERVGLLHPRRASRRMRLYGTEDVARVRLIQRAVSNPGRRGSLRRLATQLANGEVQPLPEDYAGIALGSAAPAPLAGARYWQAVVDAMVELVVVCDSAGRVISMNPVLRAFLSTGSAALPLADRGLAAHEHPRAGDPLPTPLEALPMLWAARTGTQHRDVALMVCGPDGVERLTLWTVTPLRDVVGVLHGAVAVGQVAADPTERPEDWLAMAAHDLRSPATNILGRVDLARWLLAGLDTAATLSTEQREVIAQAVRHLAVAQMSTTDLVRTMETLLDASAIRAGALLPHLEPGGVLLDALAREAVAHAQAHTTRHAISLELPALPLLVAGDRVRLRQVLDNLLVNALKFSPAGGAVVVRLRAAALPPLPGTCPPPAAEGAPRWALLQVEDSGLGIPAAAVPRVFDRYWRAETTQAVPGTGLGLYTSRAIVAAHGGHIWVDRSVQVPDDGPAAEGTAVWHGTVMALALPLTTEREGRVLRQESEGAAHG